ncbi:MAG TPA: hypothetical protein VK453_23655 [Micromonosporaceae bacterium]|nr:hypothetical protein [Micromonosporaceae bacterium]
MPPPPNVRERYGPSVLMGAGLVVVGLAGYAFVALTARTLPVADAAALTALYFLVNTVGPGVFNGLEQETSRASSAARALGEALGPVIRRALRTGLVLLVGLLLMIVAVGPVLVTRVLYGHWALLGAVALSAVAALGSNLVRGLLAGAQAFTGYGISLAVEGLVRLVPCVVIATSGVASAWLYGLVYAGAQLFAAAAGALFLRRRPRAGGPVRPAAAPGGAASGLLVRGVLLLVLASLLIQLVQNLIPMAVNARMVGDKAVALAFGQAFILVRSPVLVFAPVQAMLLPALTAAVTRRDFAFVRRRVGLILALVAGVGTAGTLFFLAAGPEVLRLMNAPVSLPRWMLAVLGLGTMVMMAVNSVQPALLAFERHRYITIAWLAGVVSMVGLLALPTYPVHAALLASVASPAVVLAILAVGLAGPLRSGTMQPGEPATAMA